jgi:hypothetical protein
MGDSAPDDGVVRDAAWMDAERKRVIAREYLTHIGEAKQYVCAQTQREIELEREGRSRPCSCACLHVYTKRVRMGVYTRLRACVRACVRLCVCRCVCGYG